MEPIPKSYIKNEDGSELDIHGDVNMFWPRLAVEIGNLKQWSNNCYRILLNCFGMTYTSKLLDLHQHNFIYMYGSLARIFAYHDYLNLDIQSILSIFQSITGKEINWVGDVFNSSKSITISSNYRSLQREREERNVSIKKYKKSFTPYDYVYINSFIHRMNKLLDYLEKNVTNLPFKKGMRCIPLFEGKDQRKESIQTLKNTIKKMKKKINKLSINFINIVIEIDYDALKKKIEPFKEELIQRRR